MEFLNLLRLLPGSAIQQLGYSLIPGAILLFGFSWIRWDLVTQFLAFPLLDSISKSVLVALAVLVAGYLIQAIAGGILWVLFLGIGAIVGGILKSRLKLPVTYGRSIVWRRIVGKVLGTQISSIQEPGLPLEEFKTRFKSMTEPKVAEAVRQLSSTGSKPEEIVSELMAGLFGEPISFAAREISNDKIDAEWQAVYRILNSYLLPRQSLQSGTYFVTVLLSSGTVLWALYHFWLTPLFPLWVAGFLTTAVGAMFATAWGFIAAFDEKARGEDETQAVEILRTLIAPQNPPKVISSE